MILMKKILIMGFLMLTYLMASAQIDKMKDLLDDEMDTDNLTLRFINALDGNPVPEATVEIDNVGIFTTDIEGKIKFPRMEEDVNLVVHFKKDGFIDTDLTVEVVAETIFNNRISVSPVMALEYVRIILDWGRSPDDMDAHFTKDKQYHISYRNMKVSEDGVAQLDRDDTDSWGPETITIKEIKSDAHYEFYVHDFTNRQNENSGKLSKSGATVKVYGEGKLLEYVNVPPGDKGNKWHVFTIDKGKIALTNYLTSEN